MEHYSKEFIELLKANMKLSPSTAHKVFHPDCGACLAERGRDIVKNGWPWERKQDG